MLVRHIACALNAPIAGGAIDYETRPFVRAAFIGLVVTLRIGPAAVHFVIGRGSLVCEPANRHRAHVLRRLPQHPPMIRAPASRRDAHTPP